MTDFSSFCYLFDFLQVIPIFTEIIIYIFLKRAIQIFFILLFFIRTFYPWFQKKIMLIYFIFNSYLFNFLCKVKFMYRRFTSKHIFA
jgi:hypothetical protein